jgi:hypothetical protein
MISSHLIIILTLAGFILASQNGISPQRAGWTSSPTEHGTADILWSCLLTILACSWTILHQNIPAKRDSAIVKWGRKLSWMIITIVAPELTAAQAYVQWGDARSSISNMYGFGFDSESWAMTHGFFASMGGFFIRFDDGASYTLNLKQLEWCFENGHLSSHDISISEIEIEDRSKSSTFAKTVTCGQSIWLVLQCIARTGQHLPISRLELATCAYVACSLITWYFWLKKPFDVDQQTASGPVLKIEVLQQMLTALPNSEHPTGRVRTQGDLWPSKVASFGIYGVGLLFSAIHCIAWNSDFPSSKERFLWRLFATLGTRSSALLFFLLMPYYGSRYIEVRSLGWRGDGQINMAWESWISPVMLSLWLLYLASRFYLLFATFYTLRSMPVEVYKSVSWTKYIPHLS